MTKTPVNKEAALSVLKNVDLWTDEQLAASLRNIAMRLARRLRYGRPDDSLGPTHLAVLVSLNSQGAMTPTVLSDTERIAPSWVTRVVSQLDERGYVERFNNPDDGRQRLIRITEAGKHRIIEHRNSDSAWLAQSLVGITEGDRKILCDAFKIVEELYELR
jgi:DNA-binding MarR family transcriptional regulator